MTEKIYNIPLRKEYRKVPKYKRAKKAIRAIREFLKRHLKQDVKLGKYLNEKILEHGRKNVAHHVQVEIIKKEKGEKDKVEYLVAELVGAPKEEVKVEEKGKLTKLKEKVIGKKTEEEIEKNKVLKEKSKDEREKLKAPKLKKGKLATAPSEAEERKDIVNKPEKPSHERKK